MTENERADLRRLAEVATPGPWINSGQTYNNDAEWFNNIHDVDHQLSMYGQFGIFAQHETDAEFICAARQAVPALLDEVDALRALVAEFAGRNITIWDEEQQMHFCPWCWCGKSDELDTEIEHAGDCLKSRGRALLGEGA
jgi:hypothetical protein